MVNTIGRTYVSSYEINDYALLITMTKSGLGDLNFNPFFFQMFRCRFANATRVLLCKSNR